MESIKSGCMFPNHDFFSRLYEQWRLEWSCSLAGEEEEKVDMSISYTTFQHRVSKKKKTYVNDGRAPDIQSMH
jgi:hypothetical protein